MLLLIVFVLLFFKQLTNFEAQTGIEFTHVRLLARAFTDRSLGFSNLTLGSNQRMEFLGDTVLQLVSSQYLYKHFPDHHEGHLSLLRSSLVNNRTQVCHEFTIQTEKHSKSYFNVPTLLFFVFFLLCRLWYVTILACPITCNIQIPSTR